MDIFGYQVIPAASTDTALGAGAGRNEYLSHISFQPTTTAASAIVKDGAVVVFTLTAGTLADLRPVLAVFGTPSVTGFTVTTVNCTATAYGSFS
jgi:hypothetical protein